MEYNYSNDSLISKRNFKTEKGDKEDTIGDRESEYPGGPAQWQYYLLHNLVYPDRAIDKNIQGQVRIAFTVDEEGNVKDPFIQKSIEYSLDQASLKLITASGKWTPGLDDGVKAKTFKVQPVNFLLKD
jgi:protein TonB